MSVETLRDAYERRRADFGRDLRRGDARDREEVRRLKRIVDEFSRFARLPAPEARAVAPDELVSSVSPLSRPSAASPSCGTRRRAAAGARGPRPDRPAAAQPRAQRPRRDAARRHAHRVGPARPGGRRVRGADTGPGIPAADLRACSSPTHDEGGRDRLGLAIAHRIAEEHAAGSRRRPSRARRDLHADAPGGVTVARGARYFTGVALRAAFPSFTYTWNLTLLQAYFATSAALFPSSSGGTSRR